MIAWLAAALASPVVEADRIVSTEGEVVAEGHVRLLLGEDVLTCHSLTLDLAGGTAVLSAGEWVSESLGTVGFDSAALDFGTGITRVTGAEFTARDGRVRIAGESLAFEGDGVVRGQHVTLECACEGRSPWSVRAREVTVRLDEEVVVRRAWIRVFDVPVLPVPVWELPLHRRSGFLAPELGYGQDGARVEAPLYLTLGRSADLTLTPSVRSQRGVRLLGEARFASRGGSGQVEGGFGRDWKTNSWRGASSWQLEHEREFRVASVGQLLSDPAQLRDYGDAFLQRSTPWTEARALLGHGPLEIDHDSFQYAGTTGLTPQQLGRVALRQPATALPGGLLASGSIESAWLTESPAFWLSGDRRATALALGTLSRPTIAGPLLVEPSVSAGVGQGDEAFAWTRAAVETRLVAWTRTAAGIARVEPGVEVSLAAGEGPAPFEVAPFLLLRSSGEGLAELRITAPFTEAVPGVDAAAQVQWGAWSGRAQAFSRTLADRDPLDLGLVEAGWDAGPVGIHGSWIRGRVRDDALLHQLSTGLTFRAIPAIQIGGALAYDLERSRFNSRSVRAGWRHPTGCASLEAVARFDIDRALPDLGVQVHILP